MRLIALLLPVALVAGAGQSARADAITAPQRNPDWQPCRGKNAPDLPSSRRIALTFDDGPSLAETPRVLRILRRHHIPATFFVVGHRLRSKRARALLAEMERDPLFTIGNHTNSHANLAHISAHDAAGEVDSVTRALARVGIHPHYFRFPYSAATCRTTAMVRKRGYAVTGWNIDSADWCFAVGAGRCWTSVWRHVPRAYRHDMVGLIVARAEASGGGILLLHDTHRYTVDQLERIIAALTKRGFSFTALGDTAVFPLLNREIRP